MNIFEQIGRRALFKLDPETAHTLSIHALKSGLVPGCGSDFGARLKLNVAGISFDNPLGMAAGYDKNGEVPDALLKLGFGFTEVGTITPIAQSGNPRPRIFRLIEDEAVINRLGFNNEGHDALYQRLKLRAKRGGIIGINVGANKDATDRVQDYVLGIERFYEFASYFTINISSPNTPGLRDLQGRESLAALLDAICKKRNECKMVSAQRHVPIFLKIAPDLHEHDLDDIAAEVLDKKLEGLIISNTTLSRVELQNSSQAAQAGGLSGPPNFKRSTIVLAKMRKRVGAQTALIGVGGIASADDIITKISAGADLTQLYTSMIYAGPGLARKILSDLSRTLEDRNIASIHELRDSDNAKWADQNIPE